MTTTITTDPSSIYYTNIGATTSVDTSLASSKITIGETTLSETEFKEIFLFLKYLKSSDNELVKDFNLFKAEKILKGER